MINDEIVLIACFIITFGFIGYKISGMVRKALDKYINDIKEKVCKAEKIKLDAINMLDDAKKHSLNLNNELKKIEDITNNKIEHITDKMNKKLTEEIEQIQNISKKRIEFEQNEFLNDIKSQFSESIKLSIQNCLNALTDEQKDDLKSKMILKIDFKKLIKK